MAGSVRKLSSGRWQVRYQMDGERRPGPRTFTRKKDAERYLNETIVALERGDWHDPTKADVAYGVVVKVWRQSWKIKASTADRRNGVLRRHLLPEFGDLPLSSLDRDQVQGWIDRLHNDGDLSPATLARMFGVLRVSLNYAVKRGAIQANPAIGVDLPAVSNDKPLALTHDQVSAIARQVPRQHQMLIRTAAYGGMRFGELAALRERRIDWDHGRLDVAESVTTAGGEMVWGTPKSKRGVRTVALPKFLMADLRSHLPDDADPDALVFPNEHGGPLRSRNFRPRVWKPAVEEGLPAHLSHVRFHDLRHTCASWLLGAGINPLIVSRQLGHSSAAFTMDTYGHLMPDAHEQVQAAMQAAHLVGR